MTTRYRIFLWCGGFFGLASLVAYAAINSSDPITRAKYYYRLGLRSRAARELQGVIRRDPAHADAYMGLGTIALDRGAFDEAIAAFKRVTELYPDYSEGFVWLGSAYRLQGAFQDAVAQLQQALVMQPQNAKARYILALTYLDQGNHAAALSQHAVLQSADAQLAHLLMEKLEGAPYRKGGRQ